MPSKKRKEKKEKKKIEKKKKRKRKEKKRKSMKLGEKGFDIPLIFKLLLLAGLR